MGGNSKRIMDEALWIGAVGLGLSSLLGTTAGLLIRRISHRWNDIFLGICAGMMLAASIVCLILPALEGCSPLGWWQVALGVALGVALIGVLDHITPHIHSLWGNAETENHPGGRKLNRTLLFVMAIALHKLPEGLAAGISYNGAPGDAYPLTLTIALQNIPEGMVVAVPLLMAGVGWWKTGLTGLAVALLEVVGMFLGYALGDISSAVLPGMLGLAGGAMLYVISDEMIPETHSHGYQKQATYALVAGVVVMLMIESLFG